MKQRGVTPQTLVYYLDRKAACSRQMMVAFKMFYDGEYASSITLAAAAEGMLPDVPEAYLYKRLQHAPELAAFDVNAVANWLKHPRGADYARLSALDALGMLMRAVDKFLAVYNATPADDPDVAFWRKLASDDAMNLKIHQLMRIILKLYDRELKTADKGDRRGQRRGKSANVLVPLRGRRGSR